MTSTTFISRLQQKTQQCVHCTNEIAPDSAQCPYCHQLVNDDYSKFKQSLNQQQVRAMMITRMVVGLSFACALGFFLST